jgi:hypothetical protein
VTIIDPQPTNEHVALHRLWGFAKFQDELLLQELDHIAICSNCRTMLTTCLHSENFAEVLKKSRADG